MIFKAQYNQHFMNGFLWVTGCIALIGLILRRSVRGSVRYSAEEVSKSVSQEKNIQL